MRSGKNKTIRLGRSFCNRLQGLAQVVGEGGVIVGDAARCIFPQRR